MGGGVAGVATPLNLKKKSAHRNPRGRCDRFTRVAVMFVCVEWCYCLNKTQFSQDSLAEATPTS